MSNQSWGQATKNDTSKAPECISTDDQSRRWGEYGERTWHTRCLLVARSQLAQAGTHLATACAPTRAFFSSCSLSFRCPNLPRDPGRSNWVYSSVASARWRCSKRKRLCQTKQFKFWIRGGYRVISCGTMQLLLTTPLAREGSLRHRFDFQSFPTPSAATMISQKSLGIFLQVWL